MSIVFELITFTPFWKLVIVPGPGKTLEYSGIVILGNAITVKGLGTITNFQNGVNVINSIL